GGLIAFVSWGIVFSMTEIMEEFLQDIGNRLASSQKPFFIDTADPSKRSPEDIGRFVKTLPKLAEKFKVYLGFNLRESAVIARAVGLTEFPDAPRDVLTYSKHLRKRLGIDAQYAINPNKFLVPLKPIENRIRKSATPVAFVVISECALCC